MKLTKYLSHALTIKATCQMMEFVRWLISIKNSVTCCKEMEKDCDKKDSDKEDCYI